MFSTTEGMLLFAVLIPGFIIYNAMDRYLTRERPTDIRLLLCYLTYSGMYLIGTQFLLPWALESGLAFGLYMVIFPLVIGLVSGWVGSSECWADFNKTLGIYKEPYPTAWDAFFNRRIRELKGCYILVTLKSGEQILGLYDRHSASSEYPIANDIYLEKVYCTDTHSEKPNSEGIWIPKEEIRSMEFYKIGGEPG